MEMQFPGDSRDARVRSRRNMSELERWGSVAAGTALTLYGLSRRRPGGVVLAIFGGLLIRRGARGHCDIYEALDLNTASTSSDDRGTRIRVRLQYSPPGGKIGTAVVRLLGRDAATEIREDLRRFKQLADAGEVANDRGSGTNAEPRCRSDDRVR